MDAYERLISDAMKGDATLFARWDAVEAAWRIVDPILGTKTRVHGYKPGSWGPIEANRMIGESGGSGTKWAARASVKIEVLADAETVAP